MTKFVHQGSDKKQYVKQMFNDISTNYDLINLISSFGIDRYWRNRLINSIRLTPSKKLLDVATGTGDVAFGFFKKYKVSVTGLDIAKNMVEIARQKAKKYSSNIMFVEGDAENMQFDEGSFDALTISFGFRNVGSYDKALSEFYRVLKQNSKIAILEFSKPKSKWFAPIFKFYLNGYCKVITSLCLVKVQIYINLFTQMI